MKNQKKVQLNSYTFLCLAIFLWLVDAIICKSSNFMYLIPGGIFQLARYACNGLIILFILSCRFFRKFETVIYLLLICLGFIIEQTTGENTFVYLILFSFLTSRYDFAKVAKSVFGMLLFLWLLVIISSLLGIIDNSIVVSERGIRLSLGFYSVTYSGVLFLHITLIWFYICKSPKLSYIVIVCVNCFLYLMNRTRANFILVFVAIILNLVLSNIHCLQKILMNKLSPFIIPAFFIGTNIVCLIYDPSNEKWQTLNELTTGRLYYMNRALNEYGVSLFGQYIEMIGSVTARRRKLSFEDYFYIDSPYIKSLVVYGVLFSVVTVLFYYVLMKKAVRQHNIGLVIWIYIQGVHSIFSGSLVDLAQCILPLGASIIFYDREENQKKLSDTT